MTTWDHNHDYGLGALLVGALWARSRALGLGVPIHARIQASLMNYILL